MGTCDLSRLGPGKGSGALCQMSRPDTQTDTQNEEGILTVHSKGDKDRTVPIPQAIRPELKTQLETVSELHDKDLASGYSGVFLVDSLEKKYPGDLNLDTVVNNPWYGRHVFCFYR